MVLHLTNEAIAKESYSNWSKFKKGLLFFCSNTHKQPCTPQCWV